VRAQRTTKAQGDLFERLVAAFLRSDAAYRTRLAGVWRLADVPPEVRSQLRLPGPDEGIDLIARERSGHYWAIQAKYRRDKDHALTRGDLATFTDLAFRHCRGIDFALVAHTSVKAIRKRHLLGNLGEIGLDRWLDLKPPDWAAIGATLTRRTPKLTPRAPRPHQRRAIQAAVRHYKRDSASRGRLVMPCGTGKSLAAFWIARALQADTVLVAVPSLALIRQTLLDWTREYLAHGQVPEWLVVCSDASTGELERDEFVGEVYELGIPTTTNAEVIADFLRRKTDGPRVVFTTYQSGHRLAKGASAANCVFDLAILDEAHKTVGVKSKSFASLLFDTNVRVRRRLFMTATERVIKGEDSEVLSMDDPAVYGDRFFQLTFKEAIAQRLIADYQILTITVSDARIRDLVQRNRLVTASEHLGETEAQALAAGIALRRTFQDHGAKHAISFHRSIRAASDFAEQGSTLNRDRSLRPAVENLHISSKKPAGERADLLRTFTQHHRALLTNARCLTEGVDIPAVDCVLFADPKHSVIDTVQAAGRALRRHPGKRRGYILLPLLVPQGMDVDAFAETTEFKTVARTITALSTQDERIAEEFRVVRQGRQTGGGHIVEVVGDVPVGQALSLTEFAEAIRTKVWSRVGRANWRPFDEARHFVRGLKLENANEWWRYAKSVAKPADIPGAPYMVYEPRGWKGFGDWLGTGVVASSQRQFRNFTQAREYARSLRLKTGSDWWKWIRRGQLPHDVPTNPQRTYRQSGWAGMGDWLGTGPSLTKGRNWRSFAEARAYARSLGIQSESEWREHYRSGRLPQDVPTNPNRTYRSLGWAGMQNWLGTEGVRRGRRNWRPFGEARTYARSLGLQSVLEWVGFYTNHGLPPDIPTNPNAVYRGGSWQSWGDWLGTEVVAPSKRQLRPFAEARAYVRGLQLESGHDWKKLCQSGRLPSDIPHNPNQTYRNGWTGMGDWLGTGRVATYRRQYRSFQRARQFARSLGLRSQRQWRDYCRGGHQPHDVPAAPWMVYATRWKGLGDWLGTGRTRRKRQAQGVDRESK
jgi:superfamily II DNA or RNA helicase